MTAKRIPLARADDFHPGSCRFFTIENREIGVYVLPDGEFRAVLNVCPHKGAPVCRGPLGGTWPPSTPGTLAFAHDDEILMCPWHGREYDLRTGREIYQASPTRLRMYPIEVDDGTVVVVL
jgi:nitrite reductase/ring-hydroxylating ferredoxin subunit